MTSKKRTKKQAKGEKGGKG